MAIVLDIPELEPVVGSIRARHDWTAARGFPPHVTLVGGTLYEGPSNYELLKHANELSAAVAATSSFSLSFSRLHRYPGALVLPVDPNSDLASLAEVVSTACGVPCRPAFHSTLARADDEALDAIENSLAELLPLVATAHRVLVIGGDSAGGPSEILASWLIGAARDVVVESAASAT